MDTLFIYVACIAVFIYFPLKDMSDVDSLVGHLNDVSTYLTEGDYPDTDVRAIQRHLSAARALLKPAHKTSTDVISAADFQARVGCHPAVLAALRRPLPVQQADHLPPEAVELDYDDNAESTARSASVSIDDSPDLQTHNLPLFPFCALSTSVSESGSLATLLERLFIALRMGVGSTVIILAEQMTHGTLQSVLDEASMVEANCLPFAEIMLKELPTCITLQSAGHDVRQGGFAERVRAAKLAALQARFPHLEDREGMASLHRLCNDQPFDFTTDRPLGILDALQARQVGSVVTCSSSGDVEGTRLCPRPLGRAVPVYTTDEWVQFSFAPWAAVLSAYSLGSVFPIGAGSPPRNWVLEGRYGGGPWSALRSHTDDETISRNRNFAVFEIDLACRGHVVDTVRIRRTGPDAKGGSALQVSGIELYGRYMYASPHTSSAIVANAADFGSNPFRAEVRPQLHHGAAPPLPTEPLPPQKKKAKK